MWPDIIVASVPAPLRWPARMLLGPMFRRSRTACAQATAIIGITDAFVDWGVQRGERQRTPLDRAFPLAYGSSELPANLLHEAGLFWDQTGIRAGDPRFTAVFLGTIGHQFELETIIRAARNPGVERAGIRVVICGKGDSLDRYRELAGGHPGILFPGWMDPAQMQVLMQRSQAGLDPLPERADFLATINNKATEYLSAGLPVLSSPRMGVLFELLRREDCGLSFKAGDAEGLAGMLLDLARDAAARERMSGNALRLFERRFRAEAVYAELGAHLEEVVRIHGEWRWRARP